MAKVLPNFEDFAILANNFGQSVSSATVPEGTTLFGVFLGMFAIVPGERSYFSRSARRHSSACAYRSWNYL